MFLHTMFYRAHNIEMNKCHSVWKFIFLAQICTCQAPICITCSVSPHICLFDWSRKQCWAWPETWMIDSSEIITNSSAIYYGTILAKWSIEKKNNVLLTMYIFNISGKYLSPALSVNYKTMQVHSIINSWYIMGKK